VRFLSALKSSAVLSLALISPTVLAVPISIADFSGSEQVENFDSAVLISLVAAH
jgi:hypothetical protein